MRPVLLRLGYDDPGRYLGAVVAANVRGVGAMTQALKKGHVLGEGDLAGLRALAGNMPGLRVPLLWPDAEDMHEDEASTRLSILGAGPRVVLHGPAQGKTRLVTTTRGLARIDRVALERLNAVPDLAVYTLFDNQPVEAGTVLAEAKCTPLVVPRARLIEAEQVARSLSPTYRAVVDVLPFRPARAALLIRERLEGTASERTRAVLTRKLRWFGTTLLDGELGYGMVPDDEAAVTARLDALLAAGADLILAAGGSLSDPFDATLLALQRRGAAIAALGVPIHPGSLLWMAYDGHVPIVGVPSCGLLSEATAFDIVLPRLLARDRAALDDLAGLGHGGLLAPGMDYRFPPYGEGVP
jgi:hypothetical protein